VGTGAISHSSASPEAQRQQSQEPEVREYRTLGRTGFKVSDIGFGAGFFNNSNVLQVALDMGINYIDTGEHYVNGQSERAIGEALKNRDRKSVFLTTKLNVTFGGSTKDQLKQRFHQCLERLQTDYADCLMIHMTPQVEQVKHEAFHAAFEELKAEGRVQFLGLSNHGRQQSWWGRTEVAMEDVIGAAVEDGRFDMALFVYNFLQKEEGERIIQMCKTKNMGVTLMKTDPINLYARIEESLAQTRARNREVSETRQRMAQDYEAYVEKAQEFKQQHGVQSESQARAAAIKFVLTNPDVHTVCPSINTFDALTTYVGLSGEKLTDEDDSLLDGYDKLLGKYYCRHGCGTCEGSCPSHVPINTIMRYSHYFESHNREKHAMQEYAHLGTANVNSCLACVGHCEAACPHGVPVRSLLVHAHDNLVLA
jgi:predicted aldo/keto reductase-like oxidoreductase